MLRVEGEDAPRFLHGLLTADVDRLAEGAAVYAALLSPQGRILSDMFVFRQRGGFLIDCAVSQREALLKRLGLYRLRARVTIGADEGLRVGVSPVEPAEALRFADPRCAALGWRFLTSMEGPATEDYEAARIALGLADSDADLGSGEFFPHEANLDQLGGVSFTKGCYVGQEVVSRMEHRGTARSRILPVSLDGPATETGMPVRSGDKQVGTMLSSSGAMALALIRLDRLAEADRPLLADTVTVTVLRPRWARFEVPLARDTA